MLQARMTATDVLELTELPDPEPGPGEVLIRVDATTLCPTDVRILRGEKTSGVRLPVVLGHEVAGHVAQGGSGVDGYPAGAAVALMPGIPCRRCWPCTHDLENACEDMRIIGYSIDGGLAEHLLVPAAAVEAGCLFVADTDLPSEALALAEPLACVVTGQRMSPVEPGDVVLIMGAGPIGLLHLQMAILSGARTVIVSQPSADRRAVAERMGASVTVDPTSEDLAAAVAAATDCRGVDGVVICAGAPELVRDAMGLTRVHGRVNVFAGLSRGGRVDIDANQIHYRQVVLTGSSNTRRRDYGTALQLITSGRIDTAAMVTHRFPLSAVHDAIATVAARDALKVAVLPRGAEGGDAR